MPAANLPTVAPQPKPLLASRTLWFNAVALALTAAESQLNVVQPLLPVNVYALVAFVLPVVNGVLRLVTSQPLAQPTLPTLPDTSETHPERSDKP
jgi:hypothetical protein